ncbi:MAG: TonB family protein, partial [Gammaproteobacteria bacterium]|nr:TonB family protein [Gammaproteobacteria bacterium]
TTTSSNAPVTRDPADVVLYLGAAIVLGVGVSWLILSQPWQGSADNEFRTESVATATPPAGPAASRLSTAEPTVDEALRMADVALSAGILIEPERYSAWKLYTDVLRADPNNIDARDGIRRVTELLLARATTALQQARTSDAREILALVQRQFPDDAGAAELAERINAAEEVQRSLVADDLTPPRIETNSESLRIETPSEPQATVASAAPDLVDPLEEMRAAFDAALAAGNLLQPAGGSAEHFLSVMVERDADHALTSEARMAFINTVLSRATEATEALDAVAAEAWIDAAIKFGADAARVDAADAALTTALVTAESQRLRPATELLVESYAAPRYPPAAERRNIEGWVDVEFVVTTSGQTREVAITDASHDSLFRQEAVAAVEAWRFVPKVYLDRPIEQRAYMRIRFALE